jgi:OOP family OmpA-OmpF porin
MVDGRSRATRALGRHVLDKTGAGIVISARALVVAGVAAICLPGISIAQESTNQGYVVDSTQSAGVVTSGTGLCWHTSSWAPGTAVAQCDPNAMRKVEAPVPIQAAVAPPPTQPVAVVARPPSERDAPLQAVPIREAMVLPQNINLSADAFFDFDKSVLKPQGKLLLDDLVRKLADTEYETIAVTGHTDRIGGREYNQRLSERRANAVKDYLVGENILASRVVAQGKGDMQPTVKSGECDGAKSIKVLACLQPDRRVDIEVSATR